MPDGRAVLLTAQGSDPRLLPTILLESTLIGTLQVFILNSLKPFRMNKIAKSPYFAQFWCTVNPFRINTCKSVSKQTTLTSFRINTYEKQGVPPSSQKLFTFFAPLSRRLLSAPLCLGGCHIFHLPYALPSSVSCNPFVCHSCESTGGVGVFFPFRNSSHSLDVRMFRRSDLWTFRPLPPQQILKVAH